MFGLFKSKKLPALAKGVYVVFEHNKARYHGHIQSVNSDGTFEVRSFRCKVVFFVRRSASELTVSREFN